MNLLKKQERKPDQPFQESITAAVAEEEEEEDTAQSKAILCDV